MFETNMTSNLELLAIQGDGSNPWRKLVSEEWTIFLDSMTAKQETTGDNCDE